MESRPLLWQRQWQRGWTILPSESGGLWQVVRPGRSTFLIILRYAGLVVVPYFRATSVFGFALLLNMIVQFYTGFLLALYYIPDPSFVMTFREEYMHEVWWFAYVHKGHVIGVDSIFVLSYLHIGKKVFIKNYMGGDLDGWVTGSYAFLVYHVVVFLGITLSSNHLGDVTVTIGAGIFWSIMRYSHKTYAPVFTNKHLNVDQLTRFMIAHYVSAWYYFYLVQVHVMFIHEMWDADSGLSAPLDNASPKLAWVWDALQKEAALMLTLYIGLMTFFTWSGHPSLNLFSGEGHPTPKPVDYSFFEQWSETEMEEINYFIIAPHWYFRPHMGLLTVCSAHYEGLAWLGGFYAVLALLPLWARIIGQPTGTARPGVDFIPMRESLSQQALFVSWVSSMLYVGGTLPCGRFFYDTENGFFGNTWLRASYQHIYAYLIVWAHALDRLERALVQPRSRNTEAK